MESSWAATVLYSKAKKNLGIDFEEKSLVRQQSVAQGRNRCDQQAQHSLFSKLGILFQDLARHFANVRFPLHVLCVVHVWTYNFKLPGQLLAAGAKK